MVAGVCCTVFARNASLTGNTTLPNVADFKILDLDLLESYLKSVSYLFIRSSNCQKLSARDGGGSIITLSEDKATTQIRVCAVAFLFTLAPYSSNFCWWAGWGEDCRKTAE